MDTLPIVFTLLSLIGGILSVPSVTISSDATDQYLDAGDVVTITCRSNETQLLDTVRLRAQAPSGIVSVMTNTRVEDMYRARKRADGSNRYTNPTFNYNADDKTVEMMVTINGIQAEDSGIFRCELQSEQGATSQETLTLAVKVPVTVVAMGVILPNGTVEKIANNSEVSLSYGTQGGLACIVRLESYVINPVVNVTIDGVPSPVDFVRGLARLVDGTTAVYEYTDQYVTSEPHYSLDGSVVRCSAHARGFEENVQSAQINAIATYKPVITCVDENPMASLGGEGVIVCHVVANPAVKNIEVHFGMTVTDKSYSFMEGKQIFESKYTLDREDDGNNVTITFTISDMTEALLDDYVYQLRAVSDLGETKSSNVRFQRGSVSSSTKVLSSWALLTVVSAIFIFKSTFKQLL